MYENDYKKLPNKIFCKALKSNVYFTKAGFHHVFREKMRNQKELEGRAKNIVNIPILLQNIGLHQFHTKKQRQGGDIQFWNIQGVLNLSLIHI